MQLYISPGGLHHIYEAGTQVARGTGDSTKSNRAASTNRLRAPPAPSINDSVAQMALCSALGRPNEEQGRLKGPCWTFASCAPTIKLCRPDRGVLKQPIRTNQPQTQPGTGQGTCGQTWLGANRPSHVEKELHMPRSKRFATRLDFHVYTGAGAVMRTAARVARTPFASGAPLHCS